MTAPLIEDTTTDNAADVDAIRRVIADAERAFNAGDAELLVEHVAENATAVGVTGVQLDGRAAVLEASKALFAGRCVVFMRPDVALVHKHATAIEASGAAGGRRAHNDRALRTGPRAGPVLGRGPAARSRSSGG